MSKKRLQVRNTHAIERSNQDLPKEYPIISNEIKSDPRSDLIEAGLNQFTPENVPNDYQLLKKEIKFLEKVHAQSFVILAHRLKKIRDEELYKQDGYFDFKAFVENELEITRQTIYKYISIVELFDVAHVRHEIKTSNLFIALPIIKGFPDKKYEIFDASQSMGRKDFLSYLKKYREPSIGKEEDPKEEDEEWFNSRDDLLSNSKFLREGMKPKTQVKMMKELLNLRLLEDPKNKTLEKMRKLLNTL